MFSFGGNTGFSVFWGKYKPYYGEKGVFPTPVCQLLQIHGSIFEPDPSCDCGQASMVCITHGVFLFRVRKDMLYRFFTLSIEFLRTFCFLYLFHQVQMLLPDVRCECLLTLFICAALCRNSLQSLLCAAVGSLSLQACSSMLQDSTTETGIGAVCRGIGVFSWRVSFFAATVSCVGGVGAFPSFNTIFAIQGVLYPASIVANWTFCLRVTSSYKYLQFHL